MAQWVVVCQEKARLDRAAMTPPLYSAKLVQEVHLSLKPLPPEQLCPNYLLSWAFPMLFHAFHLPPLKAILPPLVVLNLPTPMPRVSVS